MSTDPKYDPAGSSTDLDKAPSPEHQGGSAEQNAKEWSGGSKAAKGGSSASDKHNQNSTNKS